MDYIDFINGVTMDIYDILSFGLLICLVVLIVLIIGVIRNYNTPEKILDGINIRSVNESDAWNIAKEKDPYGDWVCVNIKNMTYKRALEVCNHEVGHEIFAEVCEDNMTKCLSVLD